MICSPYRAHTAYNKTAAQWSSARAGMVSTIYPSGFLATLVDTVETSWAVPSMPPGCARIDRYTISAPGGRTGGSPLYTFWLTPTATSNGKLLLWGWGHDDYAYPWWLMNPTDGSSVVLLALALGYHVLVCEMPGTGAQPNPQLVTINGTTAQPSPLAHSYAAAESDGGPNPMRMFTDHCIRSLNQALSTFTPSAIYAAGHSGGGYTVALLGTLDDRIRRCAIIHGGIPRWLGPVTVPGAEDYEQFTSNPIFNHCLNEWTGMVAVSAAYPLKRTLVCHAEQDTSFLTTATRSNRGAAEAYWSEVGDTITTAGGSLSFYWSLGDHTPTIAEAGAVISFLEAP